MKIFNRRDKKVFRRENRHNMNDLELTLWNHLRNNQLDFKFRRQHSIGPYIVDFFCPSRSLVVEVDGDTHYQPKAIKYDRHRDDFLRSQGLIVLRFTNLEVRENLAGVVDAILDYLSQSEAATPAGNPPPSPLAPLGHGGTFGKGGD